MQSSAFTIGKKRDYYPSANFSQGESIEYIEITDSKESSKVYSDQDSIHSDNSICSIRTSRSLSDLNDNLEQGNNNNSSTHSLSNISLNANLYTLSRQSSIHRSNSANSENSNSESENMANQLKISDFISEIPNFEGYQKDLEHFISTNSTYYDLLDEAQKPNFIRIITTKFKGIALAKMQPFDTLLTWDDVKKRLEEKFKRPNTYENAQEELNNVFQARNESIEVYGNRIRLALHKLNSASENLTTTAEGIRLLRSTNEKFAIRKFEQNLISDNLKIWVGTKDCKTLDSAISFAMQKEYHFKSNRKIQCNYCNREGHQEIECRQKQRNQYNSNRNNSNFNRNGNNNASKFNQNRFQSNSDSQPKYNGAKNGNNIVVI